MGWASGFRAGSDVARQAIETYQKANQQREFDRIAQATPETSQGFTAQDGEQLQAIANAKDANGNPYYTVEAGQGGGYGIRSNFQVQGADGQMTQPEAVGMAPRQVTDFLGQRYAGSMDQVALDRARYGAYGDVVARTDPVQGLRMRRELAQQERDDVRFQDEQRMQPLKQRAAELQVSTGERAERVGQRADALQKLDDEIAQIPVEGLRNVAAMVNLKSNVPMLYVGQNNGKYKFLTTDAKGNPSDKPLEFDDNQLRQLARGYFYGAAGYGKEATEVLSGVSKELAALIQGQNQVTEAIVRSGNDAQSKADAAANDRARTGIAAQGLAVQRGAARKLERFIDAKGNSVLVDVSALPTGKDGTLALPPGLRPATARPEVTTDNIISYARTLVENGTPDPDSPNKPLTMDKAMTVARAQLGGQGYQSAADRIVEAYLAGKDAQGASPAAPAPTKEAPRGLAPRQIGTIVPPRSAADMKPKQPMSEEEIIKMLAR